MIDELKKWLEREHEKYLRWYHDAVSESLRNTYRAKIVEDQKVLNKIKELEQKRGMK